MAAKVLPPELVSLIHHVELNKHGWWDKAIERLALAALWLSPRPLDLAGLADEIYSNFGVRPPQQRLREQVEALISSDTLIAMPYDELRISESALQKFQMELEENNGLEKKVRVQFADILSSCCPLLPAEETWKVFYEQLLLPTIREMGARTYDLISGAGLPLDRAASFNTFLGSYPLDARQQLRLAVITFLNPKNVAVRSYVLRHLNAFLFLEASNLRKSTIAALSQSNGQPPTFLIFVDTNFLFSILELHENPSNEAAKTLMNLIGQLSAQVKVKLYLLPPSVDETKRVIRQNQEFLCNLEMTSNLVDVALDSGLSGMTLKFLQESKKAGRTVKAEDYFGPYLSNLVTIVRAKGLELYNESIDTLKTTQSVIDDIMEQLEKEKARPPERAKTYEALEHDMVLWHFVKSKRPTPVESPLQARYWIATVDYHFLAFDQWKRRNEVGAIPVCFHPAALIQMLQLWLPRTPEFEEAAMGSLRLPFLLGDFDAKTERVTIRILQTLARFEGIEDLSQETIRHTLLNQALRQKLAAESRVEQQVQLVREALFDEEKKIRAELEERQAETESLRGQAEKKEQTITQLQEQFRVSEHAMTQLQEEFQESQAKLSDERHARQLSEERVKALELERNDARTVRIFLMKSLAAILISVTLSAVVIALWKPSLGFWRCASVAWAILLPIWAWLVGRYGNRSPAVKEWKHFSRFHQVTVGVWVILGWVVVWNIYEAVGATVYSWVTSGPMR